ncbi:MAG: Ig-like domain-containing protein [Anaerolineales bacterium]
MAKKDTSGFEPGKRFTRVNKQQGEVRKDSDWNQPGSNRLVRWGLGLAAVGLVAVVGFVLWQRRASEPVPIVVITNPAEGALVPVHGTFNVTGEANSPVDIGELQLIVNGQPWGSRTFDEPSPFVQGSWKWTPSGEGAHELILRAIDVSGQTSESSALYVLASSEADIQFPIEVSSEAGDTFESLAESYGVDPLDLISNHPELDPNNPLPEGSPITIPVTIPNDDPAGPEGGGPPAPPKEPLPDPQDLTVFPVFFANAGANFTLVDGKLVPGQPMDNLYLYISVDGEVPWKRVPSDPLTFLQPGFDGFDISQYVDMKALAASPTVHSLDIEAWGWRGGTLVFLGSYHGNIGGGLTGWPPSETQLQIATHTVLGVQQYAHETNLVGENPNRVVDFAWSTAEPAFFVMWQISTEPFPQNEGMSPQGLVLEKLNWTLAGKSGQFEIDFGQFYPQEEPGGFFDSIGGFMDDLVNSVTGELEPEPDKTFPDFLPMTFYVRILASKPGGGSLPSNTVIVRYLPTGEVLAELAPSGPIYEAQIIEYVPYRAADPAFKACTVLTHDIVFQSTNSQGEVTSQVTMPEGFQSCGCPGVKCSSGGSDCGISPTQWGNCLADAGEWFVNAVSDTVNFAVDLYQDAKGFVIDTLASFVCGSIEDKDAKQVCETGIAVGVNVAITAFTGIPPDIPNFDELFDEGLEYAIASMAAQATGVECDKTCRELIKKGFQGLSDPEQLYEEGLDYGISLAADELKDLGVECDPQCQGIIEQGVQGNINLSNLSPEDLEQHLKTLAHEAALQLQAAQKPCDAQCEDAIFDAYMGGVNLGKSVAAASESAPQQPDWVPHELSQQQPAIVKIQVFRRFESTQLNEEIIAERCTGFSIDSFATNNNYSMPLSGRLFEPKFVDMPLIEPGGSVVIPVVLDEATWELPAGFDWSQIPLWMRGYTDVGTEDGQQLGQVQQQLNLDAWWMWNVLNYGSKVEFSIFGPYMLDVVNGQAMGFPCFAESSQSFQTPFP